MPRSALASAATMTWWLAQIFRNRDPDIKLDETRMLVRDGQYLTAGSAFSQLDLALAIVTDTMDRRTLVRPDRRDKLIVEIGDVVQDSGTENPASNGRVPFQIPSAP